MSKALTSEQYQSLKKLRDYLTVSCLESIAPQTDIMGWSVTKGLKGEQEQFYDPTWKGSQFVVRWQLTGVRLAPADDNTYEEANSKPVYFTHEEIVDRVTKLRKEMAAR